MQIKKKKNSRFLHIPTNMLSFLNIRSKVNCYGSYNKFFSILFSKHSSGLNTFFMHSLPSAYLRKFTNQIINK